MVKKGKKCWSVVLFREEKHTVVFFICELERRPGVQFFLVLIMNQNIPDLSLSGDCCDTSFLT